MLGIIAFCITHWEGNKTTIDTDKVTGILKQV